MQMKRSAIIAAACVLTIGVAQAGSNGTLGRTSTGTQNISATVPDPADARVRVSGLNDVILGTLIPGRTINNFSNYCFFHTSPTFSLTVQQSEVSTPAFALVGPEDATVPLQLTLNLFDVSGFFISHEPINGVARTGLTASRNSENCSNGGFTNGNLSVTPGSDLTPGNYSATLTFVMAVE
jgi:hypothetical protein